MIELRYSLVIEATSDPNFFAFYSPELEGFSGTGSSIENCLAKAREAMVEHVGLLKEQGLPVPRFNPNSIVTIKNSGRIAPAA
ncbi:MAG TPA: type II toxin-antitoxin system HicB family antitoxin [Pyrinomonadaceae bacterium]|nr:type II toxin-antitoxin system HicB family antitoxin [Pyrinomonadaceae bacterium]